MSSNQFLIIHKLPILFNILNEMKKNLNFKVEYFHNDEFKQDLNKRNLVIISKENKYNFQNQINIDEFPINIQKFIEIVNVQFLKNKFNQQNNIKIGSYFINLNSRVMSSHGYKLSLTEKETGIIIFLSKSKKPISIIELQKQVWGYKSKLETHTVETHIYRLRKKIERKFKDIKFISSVKGGYKIDA